MSLWSSNKPSILICDTNVIASSWIISLLEGENYSASLLNDGQQSYEGERYNYVIVNTMQQLTECFDAIVAGQYHLVTMPSTLRDEATESIMLPLGSSSYTSTTQKLLELFAQNAQSPIIVISERGIDTHLFSQELLWWYTRDLNILKSVLDPPNIDTYRQWRSKTIAIRKSISEVFLQERSLLQPADHQGDVWMFVSSPSGWWSWWKRVLSSTFSLFLRLVTGIRRK